MKKMKKIAILIMVVMTGILSGCKSQYVMKVTTTTCDLIGSVELYTEETMKATYDENWNVAPDTLERYQFITRKNFDKEGIIKAVEYLGKDDENLGKLTYDFSDTQESIFSYQYDKNEKKIKLFRFESFEDSVATVETVDVKTDKTVSVTQTKYEKGKIAWQKTHDILPDLYSEYYYYRDEKGVEIKIKTSFGPKEQQQERTVTIKYLAFDTVGNWTKRIEFDPSEANKCLLKTRVVKYFD